MPSHSNGIPWYKRPRRQDGVQFRVLTRDAPRASRERERETSQRAIVTRRPPRPVLIQAHLGDFSRRALFLSLLFSCQSLFATYPLDTRLRIYALIHTELLGTFRNHARIPRAHSRRHVTFPADRISSFTDSNITSRCRRTRAKYTPALLTGVCTFPSNPHLLGDRIQPRLLLSVSFSLFSLTR